jgi:lysophospholipase L1-like esterase
MRICIFGDSIAWGANDFECGGWAAYLWRYLYEKDETDVCNLGISGDVTTQTLKRFDVEASARRADAIMFALGVNDSAYVKSKDARWTPHEEFTKNLPQLYEKAGRFTDNIVFIGLTPVDETKLSPAPFAPDLWYDSKSVQEYDAMIEQFCKRYSAPYVPMDDVLTLDNLSDGLHPNSQGHRRMFERIKQNLYKKLKVTG